MLCDHCGKNEAVIHFSQTVDNQTTEMDLCEKCAREKGIAEINSSLPGTVADLLAGFIKESEQEPAGESVADITCAACGLTGEEFRRRGNLGCPDCYQAFRRILAPLLKQIHGSERHQGKSPRRPSRPQVRAAVAETGLTELRANLAAAVREENYEEAARLRDRIRELGSRAPSRKNDGTE